MNGLNHTFPDDIDILLVSPSGAKMIIWSDAGEGTTATGINVTLDDAAAAALPDTGGIPSGTYKPANYGTAQDPFAAPAPAGPYTTPAPGGTDTLTSIFGGTAGNGTWSLYVVDDATGDTGSFTGGWSLDITAGGSTGCAASKPPVNFDGDNKTDFSVVRNNGGTLNWYNYGSTSGFVAPVYFGLFASDIGVPGDYDGDGKTDIAVWRTGTPGAFYILQSQTGTLRTDVFGTTNDDPTVTADYTGDGKADPAVYRNGSPDGGASYWYYLASSGPFTGQIVTTQWGINGDFSVPGDYDGDGKTDVAVWRPGSPSTFYYLKSSNGSLGVFNWE